MSKDETPLIERAPCREDAPLNVVVFVSGNGGNLQSLIDKAHQKSAHYRISLVVSNVPGVRAIARADAAQIGHVVESHRDHASREEFEQALLAHCQRAEAEAVVLAGFMRVLTSTFLDGFDGPVLNVHPALCPAFPGLHAPRQALDHGVRITGCTVHLVDSGVDTGPILAQAAVAIEDEDNESTLTMKIQREEHRLLPRVVEALALGEVVRTTAGPIRLTAHQATTHALSFEHPTR